MSTTTKGGASLRLVTGLTFAGLAICAVVAANLHVKLDPACTLSRRSTASSADYVAGGDSVHLVCTGLTSSTDYKVYVSSSDASSWNTASGRGTGSGSSSTNASPLPNTDGSSNKYKIFNTGAFNTSIDVWILTGNSTLSDATVTVEQGSSVPDGETFTIPVTGSVDIQAISFSYVSNPVSLSVSEPRMQPSGFTNLTAEPYEFKIVSGSGLNTSGAGGSGTSMSPYTFDTSGVVTLLNMGSNGLTASDIYLDGTTGGGSTVTVALADTSGNIIYQLPQLTINN